MKWQVLHFTSANDQLKDDAMNPYHPLTQEQRYLINAEMKTDKNLGQIALDVGGSRQTLWRERKRNKGYAAIAPHKRRDWQKPEDIPSPSPSPRLA